MKLNLSISKALLRAARQYGSRRRFIWRYRIVRARIRHARTRGALVV